MKKYVFSYGTLSNPEVLRKLLNRNPELIPANLNGFSKCKDSTPWLTICEDKNSSIQGFIFEVTDLDLNRLDAWEDVPTYEREIVEVTIIEGGKKVFAHIYIKKPIGKTTKIKDNGQLVATNKALNNINPFNPNLFDLNLVNININPLKRKRQIRMTQVEKTYLEIMNNVAEDKFNYCLRLDAKLNQYEFSLWVCFNKIKAQTFAFNLSLDDQAINNINELKLSYKNKPINIIYKEAKFNDDTEFRIFAPILNKYIDYIRFRWFDLPWDQRLKAYQNLMTKKF